MDLPTRMNDTILRDDLEGALTASVAEALKCCREGDLLGLSTSPLAHTSLVEECFLIGEPTTPETRGHIMQSLLRWAVDKLRPDGQSHWLKPAWRNYNILYHFYLEGMRASVLAENMGIAEQTLYQARPQAIAALAAILRHELVSSLDRAGRRNYVLSDRYARHSAHAQTLLRLTSVFQHATPATVMVQLAVNAGVQDISTHAHALAVDHLLIESGSGSEIVVHPEVRQYLRVLLTPHERRIAHRAAGEYYLARHDFLESARQLRSAGDTERAARLLSDHQREILDNLQAEELAELLAEIHPSAVSPNTWARLRLVAGELAEFTRDLDAALEEYRQALGAPDLLTKATAYYRRARVFEHKNIDESLAHYAYAIRLLEEPVKTMGAGVNADTTRDSLLARIYIGRAWIFIQVRTNLVQAHADLQRAEALIDRNDRAARCDLSNAQGEYYHRKQEPQQSVEHYWQAWLAANELQDRERMSRMAHNLGLVYMDLQQYDQALDYLGRSRELARQTGNRQVEGVCAMSIGACFYWLGQMKDAIRSYATAAEIFADTGNRTLLTRTYYGLAEAYIETTELELARRYFADGVAIAQELGDAAAQREFSELAQLYPGLMMTADRLNARQQRALSLVNSQGAINNRQYRQLTGIAQKQAVRDLNDLVERGLLARIGHGRAAHYVLATAPSSSASP